MPKADTLGTALHEVLPIAGPGCAAIGASGGAIDPKTHQKWVRAYIEAIAKLVNIVMSIFDCCVYFSS